jgi:hypothetical protein
MLREISFSIVILYRNQNSFILHPEQENWEKITPISFNSQNKNLQIIRKYSHI